MFRKRRAYLKGSLFALVEICGVRARADEDGAVVYRHGWLPDTVGGTDARLKRIGSDCYRMTPHALRRRAWGVDNDTDMGAPVTADEIRRYNPHEDGFMFPLVSWVDGADTAVPIEDWRNIPSRHDTDIRSADWRYDFDITYADCQGE